MIQKSDPSHPMLSLVATPLGAPTHAGRSRRRRATLSERLAETTRLLEAATSRLADKERECDELARALADHARQDELTGLANRRRFQEICETEIARSRRYGHPLALIMIDIDGFKAINERHGRPVGDLALVDIARILGRQVRVSDALCRWDGEEFMILAPHLDFATAVRVAQKLRSTVARADFGIAGPITCSVGVATLNDGDRVIDLVLRADTSLYRAKSDGEQDFSEPRED